MPRRPRKPIVGVPEAELKLMQQVDKGEATQRKRKGVPTLSERARSQNHVEQFIGSLRISSFPVHDEDLQAEAAFVYTGPSALGVLTPLVESALALGARRPTLGAQAITTLLFGSYDDTNGCDVRQLQKTQLSVERVLAHLTALAVRLEPRVAFAVARRATQVLLNATTTGRVSLPPGPLATEPEPPELVDAEPADEPDEELCVECGATYPPGSAHRCAAPAPLFPVGEHLNMPTDPVQALLDRPVPQFEEQTPCLAEAATLAPDLSSAEPNLPSIPPDLSSAEPPPAAVSPPSEPAPRAQRQRSAPNDEFWNGSRILVLDFTGKHVRPVTAPIERQHHERVERKVIGWARTRVPLLFFVEEGIGKDGHTERMEPNTLVEVLKPDDRDERDKEYRKRIDQNEKREPRQQVVVRWWGGTSLVWGSEIEAVNEDVYKEGRTEAS